MTRRDLLRASAGAGLGLALARAADMVPASAAPPQGGALRVGAVADVHTMDPHYSVDWSERPVMYAIYNTLTSATPTFDIAPELARAWKISADGLSVTVSLQPNVKFHDGTACDAAAVKWNIDFILNRANNSPQFK
ncbi:MAG TPA: ABC transporter substrate-binding protein, partial [bacterium]|nr:ABC transporter substrate-binding protein [bacterium]